MNHGYLQGTMSDLVAVVTDNALAWIARSRTVGYGVQITKFVVGSRGHDPANPRLPLAPDPTRTGCYCDQEALSTSDGCLFGDFIDAITWRTSTCPIVTVRLESNEAVGTVTSICLIAEVVCSTIPNDPAIGTEFLYAIVNRPFYEKVAGEAVQFDIAIPLKL